MNFAKDLKLLIKSYVVFFTVFFLHRIVFWFQFHDSKSDAALSLKLNSWWVGLRFDVRVITLYFLVGLIIFAFIRLSIKFATGLLNKDKSKTEFLSNKNSLAQRYYQKFQIFYLSMGLLFFTTVFWVDIGNYSYLEERLTSKIFALLASPDIALGMVAQSYPMYIIIPALVFVIWLFYFVTSKLIFSDFSLRLQSKDELKSNQTPKSFFAIHQTYNKKDALKFTLSFFVIAFLIHSKLSQYPLRWSEAYFSKNHYLNQFALNPVQNIFDTYKFAKSSFTLESVKEDLRIVKQELGLDADSSDLLVRHQKSNPISELKDVKNVVVIMMESLAAFKLGAYGGPLQTTPNFDELARESLLFENFHVIQSGTAASIFCFITSIPDLNEEETASRNPLVVDQHTMINNFVDHEKYYFIGGDANWGNIRGVIKNNINDVHLLEEKDFKTASKTDIWGISDLELFKQAHQKLETLDKPFFAFIQTAGYHRPYTIPRVTDGFEMKDISDEDLKNYGFESKDEFNALRFSDHALGQFIKLAKTSKYYDKTLFVVYADHGLRSYNQIQLSQFYKNNFFPVYHIPFLIHSPALPSNLKGSRDSTLGYQPDMLPTIQSMLGVEGVNSSFGLDLRSEEAKNRKGIFLRGSGALPVRFFDGQRVVSSGIDDNMEIKSFRTENFVEQLKSISKDSYLNQEEEITDEIKAKARIGQAYLKTIKYKLKNNQKSKVGKEKVEVTSLR